MATTLATPGVYIEEKSSFHGRQGKVHARVSIDLQKEFKKYIYFKTFCVLNYQIC